MRDEKLLDVTEPFTNLLTQGMVLAESFYLDTAGRREWVHPSEVEPQRDPKGKIVGGIRRSDGARVAYDGLGTMSKSKNNGVDPQQLIETYGADTARFFAIFASPPTNTLEWSDEGVEGSFRFLKRLWSYCGRFDESGPQMAEALKKEMRFEIHSVLKQANYDLSKHQLNTVASAAMKILNALERFSGGRNQVTEEGLSILLRLLAPITPHICHHLWRELRFGEDVMTASWPEPEPQALEQDEIEYVVQVNGKKRGTFAAAKSLGSRELEAIVRVSDLVKRHTGELSIEKVVIVPGRLINIVV
jgi:leucyl-tRNA synthetase